MHAVELIVKIGVVWHEVGVVWKILVHNFFFNPQSQTFLRLY